MYILKAPKITFCLRTCKPRPRRKMRDVINIRVIGIKTECLSWGQNENKHHIDLYTMRGGKVIHFIRTFKYKEQHWIVLITVSISNNMMCYRVYYSIVVLSYWCAVFIPIVNNVCLPKTMYSCLCTVNSYGYHISSSENLRCLPGIERLK